MTDIVPGPSAPPRAAPRHSRRPGRLIVLALGVLFAAALGYIVNDAVHENSSYDRAHSALEATGRKTTSVSATLAQLHAALALLSARVASDSAADTQDTNQLKAAQAALTSLQAHVTEQTALIGSLQTCLGGVERALNALSVGRTDHAIAALQAVASSCKSAEAADG